MNILKHTEKKKEIIDVIKKVLNDLTKQKNGVCLVGGN